MPAGCGEQQISSYSSMFAVFKYFSKAGKLSSASLNDGMNKLSQGYQNVMRYRVGDGFSVGGGQVN